jgi:hypothetical protein
MDTLERRIQALEDREEIKEAVAKYALNILNNEPSKNADLFTDEGVFRIDSIGMNISGREALAVFFARIAPGRTYPFAQTSTIAIDGDDAIHLGVLDNPAHTEGRKGYFGLYEDKLRRVNGRWLFTDRHFRFLQGEPPATASAST